MTSPLLVQDCKRAVSSLSTLSNDELDKIMNDEEKIENILLSLDQSYLKEIESEKEKLLDSNRAQADANLSREPELVEGRQKLEEIGREYEGLSKRVEEKLKELKQKNGDLSLETTLALLQTAASEMEEQSDKFAKKFLDGDVPLDEFLEQFLTTREVMHMRAVKADKLTKILSRGDPAAGNYKNIPPMNVNSNYFPGVPSSVGGPGSVPYPMGPIGMPMPGSYFQNHY